MSLRQSVPNCLFLASRVGVLDVVVSEYLNKSHNFTNFIFYDVTLRYSIGGNRREADSS